MLTTAILSGCSQQQPLTVYMAGDSTMADRYDTIETPERGWWQVFPTFLSEKVTVCNHAKNGRSTKSFLAEGRWEKIMLTLSKSDVVVIQFGHNDAKLSDSTRFCPPDQYAENLRFMIRQAKSAGAYPILCTPIARRNFKNGELQYVHGDYPDAAKQVAQDEQIPLVDMTTSTMQWLAELGDEASQPYFVYVMQPGEYSKYPEGKTDNTHLRLQGAVHVAELFCQEVKKQQIEPINQYIKLENKQIKYTIPCGIK